MISSLQEYVELTQKRKELKKLQPTSPIEKMEIRSKLRQLNITLMDYDLNYKDLNEDEKKYIYFKYIEKMDGKQLGVIFKKSRVKICRFEENIYKKMEIPYAE